MAIQEFEMTDEDLTTLLDASKPTLAIWGSGGVPLFGTPQENANRAWARLGEKMGFEPMTVKPVSSKGDKFFTAESTEEEEGY